MLFYMSKYIKKTDDYLKIDNKFKYFIFVCLLYFLIPISYLIYRRKSNWLVCERGNDAQDNGYFFFKYLRENHPEINAVYLIKKDSHFYNKVSQLGKCVEFGSFKHILMMIAFPVKISSHLFGYSCFKNYTLYLRRHKTRDVHVFLQHGITKNDHPGLYEKTTHLDLFICGAEPEWQMIKKDFGYGDKAIYTGFARFDDLHDFSVENQVLLMPTWRRYLANLSEDEFLKSEFYNQWNSLINSKKIMQICKEKNVKLKFYLHYSLQKFTRLFSGNEIFKIVGFDDEDVHDLLKESKLLVTDFSSVYFDMAYMNKPIIYFQFDEDNYYEGHYEKGYFDYRRDGFGPVICKLNECEGVFAEFLNNNFSIDAKAKQNIQRFFYLNDRNNCLRIFNAIKKL